MWRIRLSASKKASATGLARERFSRIAKPYYVEGEALTCERHSRSMILSQASGCERPVAEARTFHKPLSCRQQGKGVWSSITFHPPRLWPARLWKRFTKCLANALPWVRARGAHCKTVCTRAMSKPMSVPLARVLPPRRPSRELAADRLCPATGAPRWTPRPSVRLCPPYRFTS